MPSDLLTYYIPLDVWYDMLSLCKRRKSNKPSYLVFYQHLILSMANITIEVCSDNYTPKVSIGFIIMLPKPREVIAADFSDRLVQTWYVHVLMPIFEETYFDEDSYSCRIGKGGFRAALAFRHYLAIETKGFTDTKGVADYIQIG